MSTKKRFSFDPLMVEAHRDSNGYSSCTGSINIMKTDSRGNPSGLLTSMQRKRRRDNKGGS